MSLFVELKRRNVIKVAMFYLVASWLIIQVAETVLPMFEVPEGMLRGLVILLAIGFPLALGLSWIYELTPDGVRRESEVERTESITPRTGRKLNIATLVVAAVAIALMGVDRLFGPDQPAPSAESGVPQDASAPEGQSATSIAVLPFVNMSDSTEQEYFSDGMTEEIINALVKVPGLSVAARTSVFAFKNHAGDVRSVGEKLGVNHILEGSVRSDGDHLRITAQLIRVDNGFHLWSETFDRKLENVFALQDEIARTIATELAISLGEVVDSVPNRTASMDAYDLYLKGRTALRERDLAQAVEWLDQATDLDPDFAPAWAAKAIALQVMGQPDAAEGSAQAALAVDPANVNALTAQASVYRDRFQWAESLVTFRQALTLDPQSPELLEDYAEFLGSVGWFEEMLEITTRGYRVDPLLMPLADVHISALILNGRLDEALDVALSAENPHFFLAMRTVQIYLARGQVDLADRALQQLKQSLSPESMETVGLRIDHLRQLLGDPDSEVALAAVIEVIDKEQFNTLEWLVLRYVGGHANRLLESDTRALNRSGFSIHEWHWMPEFAEVRAQPGFADLLEIRRLPAYWDEVGWPAVCRRDENGAVVCP